ncbi:response regulator transcription factor [Woeseia oceani]|uniref:DNA-binding response regulator n=1 Tax=Woeseia oceani TaxID=1548547 RepID=A0A193LKM4_9GAMM|nr:response regulator [Woeseia oceani]ANO52986.1 DNA-binding response regulator [Woeseia oceani]
MSRVPTVYVVDDDEGIRDGLSALLEAVDQTFQTFSSAMEFLEHYTDDMRGCLILDIRMPRVSGLELQEILNERESNLPIIFVTGHGDIPMAVEAMRRGALDFIRKPFREQELLDRVNEALDIESVRRKRAIDQQELLARVSLLTEREKAVFNGAAEGTMNKVIGFDLGISERTVEVHRANLMKKLGVRSLAELIRIKIALE